MTWLVRDVRGSCIVGARPDRSRAARQGMIKKAETPRLAVGLAMVRRSDSGWIDTRGEMTNLAVPAVVIGLATCSSSARSMAAIAPLSGPETPDGRLTGPAAMAWQQPGVPPDARRTGCHHGHDPERRPTAKGRVAVVDVPRTIRCASFWDAAAYRQQLAADLRDRRAAGAVLLHNHGIHVAGTERGRSWPAAGGFPAAGDPRGAVSPAPGSDRQLRRRSGRQRRGAAALRRRRRGRAAERRSSGVNRGA